MPHHHESSQPERSILPYMVQLDGLRALAVAAVIVHHYTPAGLPYGAAAGVRLFFCLSGFLITGILLKSRDAAENRNSPRLHALGRFYARRVLRIFPLYYFVIAVAFIINLDPARRLIWWLLTYTFNLHMAAQGWYETNFAHFWSLAVEEQFYICWPLLVLFVPRKHLMTMGVVVTLIGPLFRLSYVLSGYQNMPALATFIATPSCMDNLGMGALLAMLNHRGFLSPGVDRLLNRIVLPAGVIVVIAILVSGSVNLDLILHNTVQAIVFCCIIRAASKGIPGPAGRLLQSRPLVYCGKISYGLYVYHPLMLGLGSFVLLNTIGHSFSVYSVPVTTLALVLTFTIASASWYLIEKPINDLKSRF